VGTNPGPHPRRRSTPVAYGIVLPDDQQPAPRPRNSSARCAMPRSAAAARGPIRASIYGGADYHAKGQRPSLSPFGMIENPGGYGKNLRRNHVGSRGSTPSMSARPTCRSRTAIRPGGDKPGNEWMMDALKKILAACKRPQGAARHPLRAAGFLRQEDDRRWASLFVTVGGDKPLHDPRRPRRRVAEMKERPQTRQQPGSVY